MRGYRLPPKTFAALRNSLGGFFMRESIWPALQARFADVELNCKCYRTIQYVPSRPAAASADIPASRGNSSATIAADQDVAQAWITSQTSPSGVLLSIRLQSASCCGPEGLTRRNSSILT